MEAEMIPVVDIFAGPGGLNEGFSSVRDPETNEYVFQTAISIEMEAAAVKTLTLRAAYRYLLRSPTGLPEAYTDFLNQRISLDALLSDPAVADAYRHAEVEVQQFELSMESRPESDKLISAALGENIEDWVLIGGPPCQAYSLAGRSRRTNDKTFQDDHKHFLYLEYLHIIEKFRPSVFVMENVKGLLSAVNGGRQMFDLIRGDLTNPAPGLEYNLFSMVEESDIAELSPSSFIIKAEDYGIPQKRHRVILVGIRKDSGYGAPKILTKETPVTVKDAIGNLPKVRSTVSRTVDPLGFKWADVRRSSVSLARALTPTLGSDFAELTTLEPMSKGAPEGPGDQVLNKDSAKIFHEWIQQDAAPSTLQHHARGHMEKDLERYFLLASKAPSFERSPKVRDLPRQFWPLHKNVDSDSMPFEDRFRVQIWDKPSTTIVSHIAKDGHYYIHPDPEQMRSFTVREAARLQTFPDNYFFCGNRTQQFTQVGNAVPPLLAFKIGQSIAELMRGEVPTPKTAAIDS
ncbi:DNA (cytosine-5)-methyltransferase 1 [Paenarthrobacter sp. TE4293]|uniref:DNA cytosine methyltransferase n=1 Tax=Paenarthrobacter sp. TE4293 TaxID=3381695 RepID=UPI003D1BD107